MTCARFSLAPGCPACSVRRPSEAPHSVLGLARPSPSARDTLPARPVEVLRRASPARDGHRFQPWLLVSFLVFCFLPSFCLAAQERVEVLDTDKNGKPDEWRFYSQDGKTPVRIERDRDGDGKREVVLFFEGGKAIRSEVDRNGDGKMDLVRFMKAGVSDREQADLNFDGKPDAWIFYKDGSKDLMIMDKNYDGKPDAWFYYGQAGLKMTGGKMDENFDGKIDRTFGTVPEKESRQPF